MAVVTVIFMVLEVQFDTCLSEKSPKTKIYPKRKGDSTSPNSPLREKKLCLKVVLSSCCCFSLLGEELLYKSTGAPGF